MKTFQSIKYWIFDLDNTLYSGKTKVFEQVEKKMSKYVSDKLNVNIDEAKKIQKNYFHEYNTTLNGMIKNHKIDADEFLEFVHNIDIDFLKKDLMLSEELNKLDGKKIDYFPIGLQDQTKVKPIYKTMDGWLRNTSGIKKWEDLPENARKYISFIKDYCGVKISTISTSPKREDTILLENPFK